MIYKVKGRPLVYKMRGEFREYQLQAAAGDCSIPVRGRVLSRDGYKNRTIYFEGFLMDCATPLLLASSGFSPSQRRDVMQQMIGTIERLHAKGIIHGDMKLENILLDERGVVRLCDFGEGRYVEEDEDVWDGRTTWHFESPNRLVRAEDRVQDPPPPILEDDLYCLGLSIWQLYAGRIPREDIAGDDIELKETQKNGETMWPRWRMRRLEASSPTYLEVEEPGCQLLARSFISNGAHSVR